MKESIFFIALFATLALQTHSYPIVDPDLAAYTTSVVTPLLVVSGLIGAIFGLGGLAVKTALNVFTGNKLIESYWKQKTKYDKAKWEADFRYAQMGGGYGGGPGYRENQTKRSLEEVD
jgi:hypothetical protein